MLQVKYMPNPLFQMISKYNFIRLSVVIFGILIVAVALGISNKSSKVSGLTIFAVILFTSIFIYLIRKWLQNEE
jgi:hypothetical protein